MRFLGLRLADPIPDANTGWKFREALKKASVIDDLFQRFDDVLRPPGYLAMNGQIVDANTNGYLLRPTCAISRMPMDRIVSGACMSFFHASQAASTMTS